MKFPKQIKTFCRHCNKSTLHKVSSLKTGTKRGSLKKGSIQRARKRGRGRGFGNVGRWGSRPTKPKRSGAKGGSKMAAFKITCGVCNKSRGLTLSRAKKVEMK